MVDSTVPERDTIALAPHARLRRYLLLPAALRHVADVPSRERLTVERTILRYDGPLSDIFNPFAVRAASISRKERPVYFVAVCRDPIKRERRV
jgi:hypothetical protein